MRSHAFDRAEHDVDVLLRLQCARRFARVFIGERGDDLLGEDPRHLVREIQN